MTPLDRFDEYLRAVERRIRWNTLTRGTALLFWLALAATSFAAYLAVQFALSERSLLTGRVVIFLAIGGALALGLILPLLRASRKAAARLVEGAEPGFEQRVTTIESSPDNPFVQLIAEEALDKAQSAPPSRIIPALRLASGGVLAVLALAVISWLVGGAPGEIGYAAHLLWAGAPPVGSSPMFEIAVTPGDAKVRKGGDQAVEARLLGFDAQKVTLAVRAADGHWEGVPMESKGGAGAAWQFYLASVSQDLEYRVEAGRVKSRVYRLRVVELPSIKQILVRTKGPAWLGASMNAETKGGDVRAVEGSQAEIRVETDRPLQGGVVVLEDGRRLKLEQAASNWSSANLAVQQEGSYYIAAESEGELVRISEDYFIEAREEKAPEIRIARPGKDAKVSPIEEVVVEVEASDDFGLTSTELRYSVNGGPEKSVSVFKGGRGAKESQGTALIALEDYKMSPGDIVSLYGVARDARRNTQTDIYFLEAQPYEREYRQGQGQEGGGMMGGGQQGNDEEIAARQKEIIAATWNQLKAGKGKNESTENAKFLSDLEVKLAAQSKSLAQRMRSRQLAATNEEFQTFAKEMDMASQAMTEASTTLRGQQWKESLPAEQRALQHLLRAQSLFRQIQVAFQRGGGGGGGRQGNMRDLESLFDLELDTEKNQYETAQTRGSASERAQQADEAMKKLEELAKRQQQLAREQQQKQNQMAEKRWAQESLRREAEELRRKMEQLARENGQQQGQESQQGQSGQSQQGQQGQAGQQSARQGSQSRGSQAQQQMNRALKQLEQAMEDMRRAQSGDKESARRAAERMSEAGEMMSGLRRQETGEQTGKLSEQAAGLAERQQEFEKKLKEALASGGGQTPANPRAGRQPSMNPEEAQRLADDKKDIERDYRRLEKAMRDAMREMGSSDRAASSKLREALGEAQQNELGLRLKYGEDMLRRGFGSYLAPRERAVTDMMNRLSDQVREAQQQAGKGGSSPEERARRDRAEQAVNDLEKLREKMRNLQAQRAQQGRQGQQGQAGQPGQQGQQQGGQQGQGQQAGGRQPGQQGQGQQQGGGGRSQSGDSTRSGVQNQGDGRSYSALNDGSLRGMEQAYARAMDQLNRMRSGEGNSGLESREEIERLIRDMQRLDPRKFPGNPALLSTMEREIMPRLEQLELRLRRDLDLDPASMGQVRSQQRAKAPEGYGAAVAEYYRKLSSGK